MGKSSEELSQNVVSGGLDYLHSHPTVKSRSVAAIGFSMGAGWALWLSNKRPSEVGAVVAFYGTGAEDFSKSQASYLGHFAPEDEWEQIDYVHSVEEKIRQAGRPVAFHYYPGAKHWFFEDNRSDVYDPQAARLAWARTLDFLHSTLNRPSTK
jgi:carboxymethylenebutenolidase